MSAPVLVGFAGVLVAAVATGMLAGRCVRQPRAGLIAQAAGALGLTIALATQSAGFARGFDQITFRAVQLTALLLVPLALACVSLVLAGHGPRPPLAAAVPPGLAVLMTAGMRFPIPARVAYPLLSTMAVALVWFGASRIGEAPRRGGRDERLDGVHDGGGRYRPGDDFWPDDAYQPAESPPPASQYATYGQRAGRPQPQPPAPVQPPAPARPYGRIQIFTLLDDRAADFDRLAEEAAELVSAGEPDTLVYVIHLVPNAPLQRIFYEVYRDRAAFDAHESQPYMQRFVAGRRSLVLATNVIELRLKYAKVAPLPAPQLSGPPQRPPGPAGAPRPQPRSPARPQPPRPEPQPYDRPGYDQERYQQERYDQERYDQRRPGPGPDQRPGPSAGRPYGGG